MLTINEIIIACQEQKPITERELRLCVIALGVMQTMDRLSLRELCDLVLASHQCTKLKAKLIQKADEARFRSMKMPVDKYLGPNHTPGTPENADLRHIAKSIFKQATGQEL